MFIANKPYKTGKRCLVVNIDSCPQQYKKISDQVNIEMCKVKVKTFAWSKITTINKE
jgi:phosphoribosylpyrophosphate synthetase